MGKENVTIGFSKINSIEQAQVMREVRNRNAHYMTNYTGFITEKEQEEWWNNLDHGMIHAYLVNARTQGSVLYNIGYGLLINKGDEVTLSGAITKESRGNNFGRVLFRFLTNRAKEISDKVTLEVLITNERAHSLYKSLGYVEVDRNDKVIFMELEEQL